MPRQARIDYEGALHHVIGRGIERKHIFGKEKYKAEFHRRLKEIFSKSSIKCYAWCIMGNHFHLLLQTGETALAEVMRRLLTGYAVYYNRVNKRFGHLFENRYKSILCDRENYLLPLIRYIHLNPVRVGLIDLKKLRGYKWTGHKEILKGDKDLLIDRDEVLSYFGKKECRAKKGYEEYLGEGVELKENFSGGGLIRSMGGIEAVLGAKGKDRQAYDERILGQGNFVEEVLKKAGEKGKAERIIKDVDDLLEKISGYYGVSRDDIINTRKKEVREARIILVYMGCEYLKKSITDMGGILKIKQPASSLARMKGKQIAGEKGVIKKILGKSIL